MLWRVTRLLGNFLISFKISSNEYSFLIFIYILSFSKKSFFNLLKPILNHWSHLNLLTLIKTHRNHFTSTLLKDPLPENNHTLPILHLETQTFSSPSAVLSSSPRGIRRCRLSENPNFPLFPPHTQPETFNALECCAEGGVYISWMRDTLTTVNIQPLFIPSATNPETSSIQG